jgi:hypothetical protein
LKTLSTGQFGHLEITNVAIYSAPETEKRFHFAALDQILVSGRRRLRAPPDMIRNLPEISEPGIFVRRRLRSMRGARQLERQLRATGNKEN